MTQRNGNTFNVHGFKEQGVLKCLCYTKNGRHHDYGFHAILQSCTYQDSKLQAQKRHIDQENRRVNPDMDSQMYGHLILDEVGKTM